MQRPYSNIGPRISLNESVHCIGQLRRVLAPPGESESFDLLENQCDPFNMNTKGSVIYGWVVYTAAFLIGGGYGYYRYFYGPGGRNEREQRAELARERQAAREAEEEEQIRQERHQKKLELEQVNKAE